MLLLKQKDLRINSLRDPFVQSCPLPGSGCSQWLPSSQFWSLLHSIFLFLIFQKRIKIVFIIIISLVVSLCWLPLPQGIAGGTFLYITFFEVSTFISIIERNQIQNPIHSPFLLSNVMIDVWRPQILPPELNSPKKRLWKVLFVGLGFSLMCCVVLIWYVNCSPPKNKLGLWHLLELCYSSFPTEIEGSCLVVSINF